MKTVTELDQDILRITNKIQKEFPELSKYIGEMPVKISKKDDKLSTTNDLEEYYNSLKKLLTDYALTHQPKKNDKVTKTKRVNPITDYPPSEDIYNKAKEERETNPEDLTKKKVLNEKSGSANEKDFEEDMSGSDLDVPGSELDDEREKDGNEDEENNYYSLGGDNHDN